MRVSTSPLPAVATASFPPSVSVRVPSRSEATEPRFLRFVLRRKPNGGSTRLKAGLTEIEPDLSEEKRDRWATNGVSAEDFIYGEYDGHHTYVEGNEGPFWDAVVQEYQSAEPPIGFQGLISWLFPPAIAAGMAFHLPGEYLYIGAAVFVVIFCAIEMGKPDKPHNFEPHIYNMDRGARDKLLAAYNTMDIWDFNEKYGELWDFTVKNEDIIKELK